MSKCSDIKKAIDSYANITEDERVDIDSHVSNCHECAEYKQLADSTEGILSTLSDTMSGSTSQQQLFERVQVSVAKGRRQTLIGLAGMVTSLFCFLWLFSQGDIGWGISILLFWVAGSGVFTWWSVRKVSRFSGISENSSQSLLHSWRNDLAREIKVILIVGLIIAFEIVYSMVSLISNSFVSENAIILLSLNMILAVGVAYAFIIELPALKRERKLLDGDI